VIKTRVGRGSALGSHVVSYLLSSKHNDAHAEAAE
jgi:hypothetical protein